MTWIPGAGASVTLAADNAPAAILQPVSTTTVAHAVTNTVTAEDYQQMQASAPEVVVVRITSVKTQVGKPEDASVDSTPLMVTAQAVVIRVIRTATGLKNGSVFYLLYGYAPPVAGASSYAPIPVVKTNSEYTAYLTGGPADKDPYRPAAGAQSFIDDAAVAANAAANKPTGPIADPSVLPTPENPTPPGAPRLTRANLAQFAKAIETDGHWGVSIANADPLPLQVIGDGQPTLLAYYAPSIRAPGTQPKVLVYVAGETAANTPAAVSTERALIIDSNGRLLGDVLWAQRSVGSQNPLPLPIWRWSTYKLEVEDAVNHEVQTILLGGSTPNTGSN
jgi:hypothetical protein